MSETKPGAATGAIEDYEDLYENAPCGYLSIGPDGRIVKVNATFATWIGSPAADLLGKRFHDLLSIAGKIFYETHFTPLLRMQGFFNEVALDLVTQDGGRLPVLVNAAERRDRGGGHLFTRLTIFNATDRRRYERELVAAKAVAEAAKQELQASSGLREQFIAVLGHDLRNPVAAIGGAMFLLRKSPLDQRALKIIDMVEGTLARMGGLIDNVMDFARGRLGGGLTLDREADAPIAPMLQQIIAELQATAPARVIERNFAITGPVDCDPRRVGQLASNLLANALTHGAGDQPVRVEAATKDGWFELVVANGGAPIPPAVLERIFEPFSRGAERASMQGLGLGLYISHAIATAHGGTLEAASSPAETRFTFRMPTQNPERTAA